MLCSELLEEREEALSTLREFSFYLMDTECIINVMSLATAAKQLRWAIPTTKWACILLKNKEFT